jgi:hypothetical protein
MASLDDESLGPAFAKSRVLTLASLPEADRDALLNIFAEQKLSFFRDSDGSYVANVRMYDPNVVDLAPKVPAVRKDAKDASRKQKQGAATPTADEAAGHPTTFGGSGLDYSAYPRFTSLIAPLETVRPKAKTLIWLMRLIEEIYDQRCALPLLRCPAPLRREDTHAAPASVPSSPSAPPCCSYAKDTADLQGSDEGGAASSASSPSPFPTFVVEFFSKRYGLRSLIDQTCWELLSNVHAMRREVLEVEVRRRGGPGLGAVPEECVRARAHPSLPAPRVGLCTLPRRVLRR